MSIKTKRQISATKLKEAKAQGLKVYQSATSCPTCGQVERYVSTRSCVSCTKAKNQERKRREIESLPCVVEWHLLNTLPAQNELAKLMVRY